MFHGWVKLQFKDKKRFATLTMFHVVMDFSFLEIQALCTQRCPGCFSFTKCSMDRFLHPLYNPLDLLPKEKIGRNIKNLVNKRISLSAE